MEELSNLQIFFALLIWAIGSGIGSVVVARYIYIPWVKELKDNEEEEYKIPYEESIPFKEIYNNDVDLDSISKERYISDETPDGYVFMRYNLDEEGFEYWCDNKNVKFKFLETVSRKYVSFYLCKNLYKDRMAKVDEVEEVEEVEEDDDFMKPKKPTNNNNSKRTISNTVSNKYIYKGTINELKIFNKKNETEKDDKKKMSFADYKKLTSSPP